LSVAPGGIDAISDSIDLIARRCENAALMRQDRVPSRSRDRYARDRSRDAGSLASAICD
jgi:hypothetical protein